jgi:hypothetical protein
LLEILPVLSTGWLVLGFSEPVGSSFHVMQRSLKQRSIFFDANGPVAIYNKRGRDPDYVSDYVCKYLGVQAVVNPLAGGFSRIFAAPSTVLFELPPEFKHHLTIISQSNCISLDANRRSILASYENTLSGFGYTVI